MEAGCGLSLPSYHDYLPARKPGGSLRGWRGTWKVEYLLGGKYVEWVALIDFFLKKCPWGTIEITEQVFWVGKKAEGYGDHNRTWEPIGGMCTTQ